MLPKVPYTLLTPAPHILVRYYRIQDIAAAVLDFPLDKGFDRLPARPFSARDFTGTFLSSDDLARINRFRVQKKQVEWLCGRFALKTLAKDALDLGQALADIHLDYMDKGAPYLVRHPDVSISLSHSTGYTAAALSRNPGVIIGMDLEAIGPLPDPAFMETAFTRSEIQAMDLTPETIFRHWTLKEAFLKYIRLGFNESLHQVEVFDRQILYRGKAQDLIAWSVPVGNTHILSIVANT